MLGLPKLEINVFILVVNCMVILILKKKYGWDVLTKHVHK